MIQSRGVKAFLTSFLEGVFMQVNFFLETWRPSNWMIIKTSHMTTSNESCNALACELFRISVKISLVMGLCCLRISFSCSLALTIFVQIFSLSDR